MGSTSTLALAFPSPIATTLRTSKNPHSSSYKLLRLCLITTRLQAIQSHASGGYSQASELPDISWDNVGFDNPMTTDYMFTVKCSEDGNFSDGGLQSFGKIELNPAACVLNYGQGVIEELKAYKKLDNSIVLFRPEENGLRMRMGAERMCMPAPTVEQFVEAVKLTVLANRRWVPPPNKGFLHIKPLLMGNGPVLSLTPAPEFTFLIYASSMGNTFKGGLEPINLVVENEIHRAVRGGAGTVNAIGNYAMVLKTQVEAKADGFSDVLYLDSVHKRYVEQTSTANIFLVKDKIISTPALEGTILPGVTRKSIIEIACSQGYQVEERPVSIEELLEADEVFCTGYAVCLSPIGSITYLGKRVSYQETGLGGVSEQLYQALSNIQMGLAEENRGWIVTLK
ncbi:branched-chain-amino-acid aminotransferase 5, chloroplastic-like [Rosa rugosa]|uniref:branched-chain-amino-acid aminotransferase 5, chloroplastic-like n=1 Tax=Rosa rugosa TaxID=74645 RepID=UPI002B40E876|nr:branched-chain-amino-acid aminotransferase 5, chloroplastic-like [Rosa rugosa]